MGIASKERTGKADSSGKPTKPSMPSAKEAQASAPKGSGQAGVKG